MKKIMPVLMIISLFSSIIIYRSTLQNKDLTSIELENAAALSDDEESYPTTIECYGGNVECARVSPGEGIVHIYY